MSLLITARDWGKGYKLGLLLLRLISYKFLVYLCKELIDSPLGIGQIGTELDKQISSCSCPLSCLITLVLVAANFASQSKHLCAFCRNLKHSP